MAEVIEKRYLGDGVYAEVESGMIKLTTEYGVTVSNEIFLEPEVYRALVQYYEDATEAVRLLTDDSPPVEKE